MMSYISSVLVSELGVFFSESAAIHCTAELDEDSDIIFKEKNTGRLESLDEETLELHKTLIPLLQIPAVKLDIICADGCIKIIDVYLDTAVFLAEMDVKHTFVGERELTRLFAMQPSLPN